MQLMFLSAFVLWNRTDSTETIKDRGQGVEESSLPDRLGEAGRQAGIQSK
jgi:hypothetical protein